MLWLALHFAQLPLEVFAQDTTQACVVLDNNRVLQRNETARSHGLEVGTTLATAHSIYPALIHQHRDIELEAQRLRALADQLYRFSNHVCVQAPDCIVLEIGASLKLFGCHNTLQQAANDLCAELGHNASTRVARTPWAAIALARSNQPQLADVTLEHAGLELAGVAPNTIERFANMGIYTLGPVLDLPSKSLGRRFGLPLLHYLEQLTGTRADPRTPIVPRARFDEQRHLLQAISDKHTLHDQPYSPMQRLCQELQHWLIAHQLGCEQLQWQFKSHNGVAQTLPVRFATAKQRHIDFLRVSELALEAAELPSEVLSVRLEARRVRPWQAQNRGLFAFSGGGSGGDIAHPDNVDPNQVIDEINARLGEHTCCRIEAVEQHTPEHAWQTASTNSLTRTTQHTASSRHRPKSSALKPSVTKQSTPQQSLQQGPQRPLWLFDPPRRIARSELTLLQGPERMQTQWWQPNQPTTARDYYIAQHREGPQCWVFVDTSTQLTPTNPDHSPHDWYLHGYFG